MPYVFGKTLTIPFTPIADNAPVGVDSLVSARLFLNRPTDLQLSTPATAGFISEVTSWTNGENFQKTITFPAVNDPSPSSNNSYEIYYVAVNFKYDAAGPTDYSLEVIKIFRADGLTSKITTRFDDVYRVEPKLESFKTIAQIDEFISEATKDIFRWYKGLGYARKNLVNMEDLNDACRYRAASKACLSLYVSGAPEWKDKYLEHKQSYIETLDASEPLFDSEEGIQDLPQGGTVFVSR